MADPAINFLSFDERDSLVNGPSDSISLTLVIQDAEVLHHLRQYDDMERRDTFVLSDLKIGVLALRQAQGHVDIETLRNTIQHSGKKVCEKATALKPCITEEMKKLRNGLSAVRSNVADL